jgi:hypothetical protein
MEYKEWVPDEAVERLTLERIKHGVDPIKIAAELFKENLPLSVMSICHMAVHSPAEAIRFQAARYVVDRTMGSSKEDLRGVDNEPAWNKIYDSVLVEADNITKNAAGE